MNPIFSRVGSKRSIADLIVSKIPEHRTYIEVFVGGGSIYFKKPPSKLEVINDIDKLLIEGYRLIKDTTTFNYVLPLEKYEQRNTGDAKTYRNPIGLDKINKFLEKENPTNEERIMQILFKLNNTFSSLGYGKIFLSYRHEGKIKHMEEYHNRLQNTIIRNDDYREVLKNYDSDSSFFFLDPPYENSKDIYIDSKINYMEMATILSNIKGKFLLTLNDSEDIRNTFKDFKITSLFVRGQAHNRNVDLGQDRKEVIITNY